MEKANEEIVSNLYALRAGLSLISENADHVKRCEHSIEFCGKSKERSENKVKEKEEIYNKKLDSYNKFLNEKNNRIDNLFKTLRPSYSWFKIALPIWLIFIGPNLLGPGVLIMKSGSKNLGILLIAAYFIIPIIAALIPQLFAKLNRKKNEEKIIARVESELNALKSEADLAKSNLIIQKEENDKIVKKEDDSLKIIKGNIDWNITLTEVYSASLTKQYSNLIFPADWQNIDLIIFYLQTGRADNMKEALQLADRQRQTDAIVNEIRSATKNICNEINSGFKSLGRAMAQCFNLLSEQISAQHREMMVGNSQLKETMERLEEQNSELISAANLSNALQAKANVSSDQLKYDLEYMQYRMGMRN